MRGKWQNTKESSNIFNVTRVKCQVTYKGRPTANFSTATFRARGSGIMVSVTEEKISSKATFQNWEQNIVSSQQKPNQTKAKTTWKFTTNRLSLKDNAKGVYFRQKDNDLQFMKEWWEKIWIRMWIQTHHMKQWCLNCREKNRTGWKHRITIVYKFGEVLVRIKPVYGSCVLGEAGKDID